MNTILSTDLTLTVFAALDEGGDPGDGGGGGKIDPPAANVIKGDDNDNSLTGTNNVVDHIYGFGGNDTLYGGKGSDSDTLEGGDGTDYLYGGLGNDLMIGGAGNDFYFVEDVGDIVVETGGGFGDTVNSYAPSYIFHDDVENGVIAAFGAANMTGNTKDNYIIAGQGDNIIDGGAGYDTIDYRTYSSGGVKVSLADKGLQNTGGSGFDILANFENLLGTKYDDHLVGDGNSNGLNDFEGNDLVEGGGGDDRLITGLGNDTLDGGDGADGVDFGANGIGITVDLSITTSQTSGVGEDTFINIEHLYGGKENDKLTGNWANNQLNGNEGADLLQGNGGEDTLWGGANDDILKGGLGNDRLMGEGGNDHFVFDTAPNAATNLDTVVDFVTGADKLVLSATTFTAFTFGGTLAASKLRSGAGVTKAVDADDFLIYDSSTGALYYDQDGNGVASAVQIASLSSLPFIGASDITISDAPPPPPPPPPANVINGTTDNDTLIGTDGLDHIFGLAGHDQLYGGKGNDTLEGGEGSDYLNGGDGSDTFIGGDGSDTYVLFDISDVIVETNPNMNTGGSDYVYTYLADYTLGENIEQAQIGNSGAANLTGNKHGNYLGAGTGDNVIDGKDGIDIVAYGNGGSVSGMGVKVNLAITSPQSTGGSGFDTLLNIENVWGTNSNDHLTGNDGNNELSGWNGNDTLLGAGGDDTLTDHSGDDLIDGGSGSDTFSFGSFDGATIIDLSVTTPQANGGLGTDTILNIEHLYGGKGNDTFRGNDENNNFFGGNGSGKDNLYGAAGDDTLDGFFGNDTLNGGTGNDTLIGSGDSDIFVFDSKLNASTNVDTVTDLVPGVDKLVLDGTIFTSLTMAGPLPAQNFRSGAGITTAADSDDFIIYDSKTGAMYYDADGSGATSAPIQFLTLSNKASITAADIEVINPAPPVPKVINGTTGNDNLKGTIGNDTINGLAGNDTIDPTTGDDTVDAGAGNDTMYGGLGTDSMDGGAGTDTMNYTLVMDPQGVTVNLGLTTSQNTKGAGFDTIKNVENLVGSNYDDLLIGNAGANEINGSKGNDTLIGGLGRDVLTGGDGKDRFVFDQTPSPFGNTDVVQDFVPGQDTLVLVSTVFKSLPVAADLPAANFRSGAGVMTAADADDFIIYDTKSGALFYDADGTGSVTPVQILFLVGSPALTASDIEVSLTSW